MDLEQPHATVKSLYIYPIKACRGISVHTAFLSSTGFKWDRMWMVVNSKGRMLTQRADPRLALVEVYLPQEALEWPWGSLPLESALSIRAPEMELLQIPLAAVMQRSKVKNASVWEWAGAAFDEGPDAAEWFTRYLGKPCRLVCFDTDNETRVTDPAYASGFNTAFADGYPFLLISQASLDALNELLPNPLSINRFRPNIFVQGCEPFAEDFWQTFTISDLVFHGVKLCSRCKVTTIDQETAEATAEPLKTLRSFRSGKAMSLPKAGAQTLAIFVCVSIPCNYDPGPSIYKVAMHILKLAIQLSIMFFGQNLVCEQSLDLRNTEYRLVRVGDLVTVLNKFPSVLESMV